MASYGVAILLIDLEQPEDHRRPSVNQSWSTSAEPEHSPRYHTVPYQVPAVILVLVKKHRITGTFVLALSVRVKVHTDRTTLLGFSSLPRSQIHIVACRRRCHHLHCHRWIPKHLTFLRCKTSLIGFPLWFVTHPSLRNRQQRRKMSSFACTGYTSTLRVVHVHQQNLHHQQQV